jgi:hypothetical protein
MKPQTLKGLEARLMHFLEDLLAPMGRSERQHWGQIYVQGLLSLERVQIERTAGTEPSAYGLHLTRWDSRSLTQWW